MSSIKCPRCEKDMMNVDKQGVSVDICPNCKGIWLDSEELDEIMKRSAGIFSQEETGTEVIPDQDEFVEDLMGEES